MVMRIRLARIGGRNLPSYRLVVIQAQRKRDGLPLEAVGTYNPIPNKDGNKVLDLNAERIKYWLSVGAQPTDCAKKLLTLAELYPELAFELRPFHANHPTRRFRENPLPPPPESFLEKVAKQKAMEAAEKKALFDQLNQPSESKSITNVTMTPSSSDTSSTSSPSTTTEAMNLS